jgi:hypothetical protein
MTIVTRTSLQTMIDQADDIKVQHVIGRALVALFQRQTESEKSTNDTHNENDIGFSGADAKSGSLTAKYYLKHKKLEQWQIEKWTKRSKNGYARLTKYHKQLNDVAVRKAAK